MAAADKRTLDRIMMEGTAPLIEDVLGYEFRGWNLQEATKLLGTRKFKKGFFGDPGKGYAWGYNVPVKQNAKDEPWISEPSDDDPKRYFFFKVFPASAADDPKYPNSLVVDYRKWDEYFFLNPVRFTVDYLVYPNPSNHDLILGISYLEAGPVRPFLGYFILERYNQSGYDRTSHFLSEQELKTVEAFAEVFIEGAGEVISPREIMWNIDRHLERIDSNRTQSLKMTLFLIEHVLPRRSLWPFRAPFSKMKPAERKRFIETVLHDPRSRGPLRDLAKIRSLFAAGYYGDPRVYPSIRFVPFPERPRYQPDKLKRLGLPRLVLESPTTSEIDCEVCIVGTGAAGAVVAYHAAAAGKNVVLLEEGPYVPGEEITHDEAAMTARLYKEGGLQTTVDLDLTILQGKCLGGSTLINNAICFRLNDPTLSIGAPDVLEAWERLGARIDRAKLESAFDRVERMIGVGPLREVQDAGVPPIEGSNARALLDGWAGLVRKSPELGRWKSGLFRKNYNRCLGCGYCNFGCPYDRKMSMLETYIPKAIERGARVIVGCHAVGIGTSGRQATEVRCRRRDGRGLTVKARAVVLSCGAIGSSVLLMKSGITKNVGARFSFNAGTPMLARFANAIQAFDGIQMGAYVDLGECLPESLFNPPLPFAVTLPGWFQVHFDRMKAYDRFASAGVLIGTEPNGRVKRTSLFRSLFGPVAYRMTEGDRQKLKRGMALLAQVFFEAGAETVYPATFADVELEASRFRARPDDILPFLDERIREPEDLTLSSAHPQGGNAMSDDPSIGVVDSRFRVHGYDNLFVCDASVFPTTIRINPQLTIMAMADYFFHLDVL
jgi:choline dehydrogenase-like flavoprotein